MNATVKHPYQLDELDDYVSSRASKEINHNLKKMDYQDLIELKDSLEKLLSFVSVGTIYN